METGRLSGLRVGDVVESSPPLLEYWKPIVDFICWSISSGLKVVEDPD